MLIMRKILLCVPEICFGGAETQFRFLIDGLSKKEDIELDVIIENSCQTTLQKETNEFIKKHSNIQFIRFRSLDALSNKAAKMLSSCKMRIQLMKVLNKKEYDVILGYRVLYMLNLPYLKGKAPKVVYSVREDGKLESKNMLTKYCAAKADLIICNSQAAYDRLKKIGFNSVAYIHNGVETDRCFESIAENDRFTILVPARIENRKNQLEILKAVYEVGNNIELQVNFAGKIQEQEYYEKCLSYIREHNIEDRVSFCGAVGNIYDMYRNSDLVILASFSEGTPNVVLESFAYKRMCIASNIVMNDVLFTNKSLLFSPDDEKTLADKIVEISKMSESQKAVILEENYNFVKEKYSIAAMVDNYYKELK